MAPETQQLFDAIEDDKLADIEKLIPDADLTAIYETSPSCSRAPCQPLHAATVMNNVVGVKKLVDGGAPLEGQDKKKRTPLHLAATLPGYEGMIQELVDLGAALDPINAAGVTPLYLAITEGNVESCKVLLASGADPNSKNAKGQTALQVIVFILFENSEIVSMYIP